jgi:hypothetical protein
MADTKGDVALADTHVDPPKDQYRSLARAVATPSSAAMLAHRMSLASTSYRELMLYLSALPNPDRTD